jgi:hypothetical protein
MSKILSNGQAVGCENARESLAILQREASHRQRGKTGPDPEGVQAAEKFILHH